MIKKIRLQNFESHEDSELEFSPGVNVIIGESDKGKSSIFRAFEWIRTNRPRGNEFKSKWGGETIAEIHTGEHSIKRTKGNGNYFHIDGGNPLQAGHNAPDQVMGILQMDEVNIQYQNETPFLLSCNPGEAARTLNKAADIQIIDHTTRNLKGKIDSLNREKATCLANIGEKESELEEYKGLQEIETRITAIEEHDRNLQILERRQTSLKRILQKIEALESEMVSREKTLDLKGSEELIQEISNLDQSISDNIARHQLLRNALNHWMDLNSKIEDILKSIDVMEKRFHELSPDSCPLCGGSMK